MGQPFKHFRLISKDVAIAPLVDELTATCEAFTMNAGRQTKIKVQRESLAIPIRGLRKSKINGRPRWDVQESRWTSSSRKFPQACAFLRAFAEECRAVPGRAKIVDLPPGKRVYPHIDRGDYYRLHDRYHLVLQTTNGAVLKAGDETVHMRVGELWWFDNKQMHEAFNNGQGSRIHFIFDLLPRNRRAEAFGNAVSRPRSRHSAA